MPLGQRHTSDSDYDTVSSSLVPIVFVPGVMGTRLDIPGGSDWDPDYAPSMAGWLACSVRAGRKDLSVKMKPNANVIRKLSSYSYTPGSMDAKSAIQDDSEMVDVAKAAGADADDIAPLYETRGWGGLAWGFYGSILMYLEKAFNHPKYNPNGRHPVYAFGYDWRKSNSVAASSLVSRVNSVLSSAGADQVILVTHSMGGLVARYACAQLGLNDKVMGVVHTVQPSNGAAVCYRRFATGADPDIEPEPGAIDRILGNLWWKYTAYMSGLSGPVQLLPNQRYHLNARPGVSQPS